MLNHWRMELLEISESIPVPELGHEQSIEYGEDAIPRHRERSKNQRILTPPGTLRGHPLWDITDPCKSPGSNGTLLPGSPFNPQFFHPHLSVTGDVNRVPIVNWDRTRNWSKTDNSHLRGISLPAAQLTIDTAASVVGSVSPLLK
jgi:hypothetical protein